MGLHANDEGHEQAPGTSACVLQVGSPAMQRAVPSSSTSSDSHSHTTHSRMYTTAAGNTTRASTGGVTAER